LQAWFAQQCLRPAFLLSSPAEAGAKEAAGQLPALIPVSGDASFRRYFRVMLQPGDTCMLVDAPPPHEDCRAFVNVAAMLRAGGVNVPALLACDLDAGFMCLSDFGDELLWHPLEAARRAADAASATALYQAAFAELLKIQATDAAALPPYDAALLHREMQLFIEWFCLGLLQLDLSHGELALIERVFAQLSARALAQPQVFVHRDYHSRNLLYRGQDALGVIDFQDAVCGPLTYDLVSLLRDCYIEWPRAQVERWVANYAQAARKAGLAVPGAAVLQQDFDWMGMQRHLKVLGIFARLWLRDGKRGYLQDLPLTLRYLTSVARDYAQFTDFTHWLAARVEPALPRVLQALGVSQAA
jgi:aminoglycoside/choline kinase family phosphotransferase